jgi:hypothetical protein
MAMENKEQFILTKKDVEMLKHALHHLESNRIDIEGACSGFFWGAKGGLPAFQKKHKKAKEFFKKIIESLTSTNCQPIVDSSKQKDVYENS